MISKQKLNQKVRPVGQLFVRLWRPQAQIGAHVLATPIFPYNKSKKITLSWCSAQNFNEFGWIWPKYACPKMSTSPNFDPKRGQSLILLNETTCPYMSMSPQIWPIINFWTYIRHLTSRYWLLNIAKNILLNCSKESVGFIFEAYSIFLYYIYIKLLHIWLKFSVICFYKWLWY